jgi:predicted RNA-binding Zn-ribbon protein involved in translation (DUF1610 family)
MEQFINKLLNFFQYSSVPNNDNNNHDNNREKQEKEEQKKEKVEDWWTKDEASEAVVLVVKYTHLLPPLAQLVKQYVVGNLFVGALVDVQDQIGKWAFGTIAEIEGVGTRVETPFHKTINCSSCKALFTPNRPCTVILCPNCGIEVQICASTSTFVLPTSISSTRCLIKFFGWPKSFDEWVSIDRVQEGGTKIIEWLYEGNTVCYCQPYNTNGEAAQMDSYLMARILDIRSSSEHVFEVKIQVDSSIPYSFPSPIHPDPTKKELSGIWVPMTTGKILENGSFAPGYRE